MLDEMRPNVLRLARTLAGLSQQQIAQAVGYDQTTVSAWERDALEMPEEVIPAIAKLVREGTDPEDLRVAVAIARR
jgi:transcriptional regulator with XRE-family HTH domain